MTTKVRDYQVMTPFASHRRLVIELANELSLVDPEGKLVQSITDPRAFARTLVASIGTAGVWSEAIGPVYDVEGVKSILGISKQAISKRENLLALTTGSGRVVYPALQFVGTEVVNGMGQIRALLPKELISSTRSIVQSLPWKFVVSEVHEAASLLINEVGPIRVRAGSIEHDELALFD